MSDFRAGCELFGFILLIIIAFFGLTVGLLMWVDSAACASRASVMGMRSQWGPLTDCMIEFAPGKWIPLHNFRAVDGIQ